MDGRREPDIEENARELLIEVDRRKLELWDGAPPDDPIDLIDPFKIALGVLGVRLEEPYQIPLPGPEGYEGNLPYRWGGYVDRPQNLIVLARRFSLETRRFTLAHEIGHLRLHEGNHYRDVPVVAGSAYTRHRSEQEREANRFAEFLLMPGKPLKSYFRTLFGVDTLQGEEHNERFAQWLADATEKKIQAADLAQGRRFVSLHVADSIPLGCRHPSLARRFKVNPLAMAIRLERLRLV